MRHAPYLTKLAAAAALSATVAAQLPSCFNTDQGTPINAGDETISAALPLGFTSTWPDGTTSSDAVVTSNGRISASSAGLAPDFAVGVAEFLAGAPTIAAVWADLDFASTAGDIEFFADPQGQFAVFTFRDAVEFVRHRCADYGVVEDDPAAWTELAHVLFNLKEFLFLD